MTEPEAYREAFYPDLTEAGGLHAGLARALASIGSPLTVSGSMPACVRLGPRLSQTYIAVEERLFIFDFWFEGVCYANGWSANILDVAEAVHAWVVEEPKLAAMRERFAFFVPTEKGEAHEAGSLVEHQWASLLKSWAELEVGMRNPSPRPLIEAAMRRPELHQLFPFTSHTRLCFSRTTGFPFTYDCPFAMPLGDGLYRAYSAKYTVVNRSRKGYEYQEAVHEILGEGAVEEVLDLLVANLPPGCGPAVNGTAKDLSKAL